MWLKLNSDEGTARLRPTGKWRFFIVAVLGLWLCTGAGLLVCFGGMLGSAIQEWVSPGALTGVPEPAGYLVGMTLITTGGLWWVIPKVFVAWRNALGLMWSEDTLTITREGVTRVWRLGLWRSKRHLARAEVADVDPGVPGGSLVALMADGRRVELAQAGTDAQHQELADRMMAFFGMHQNPEDVAARTPPGWELETGPDGNWFLRTSRYLRMRKARRRGLVAFYFGVGAVLLVGRLRASGEALMDSYLLWGLVVLAALAGVRAARAWYGYEQWEVQKGTFIDRSRGIFGLRRTQYRPASFSVEQQMGDEGRRDFNLFVLAPGMSRCLLTRRRSPRALIHLGRWLSRMTGGPLRLEPPTLR
ncbi:hypothetical protein [Pyxidicoccus xibeiensis]|uniref:hypothetical protein n=1 Tax=Pyxidicoccus xibeiensis TaxID=2906759 RepID=UPI0020A7535A|nr:hypothetical protein [Pyxidicoccus xibeiensis]MCP3142828.1 hypothetical protein [Pyxidicoccus xibeiensis]